MQINKVSPSINFRNSQSDTNLKENEFIDVIVRTVRNPRDVEDCVAVPRGIFKAYIYLMAGSSLMLTAAALPKNLKISKTVLNIGSAILSAVSAFYFAKPFAVNGLSPTLTKEEARKINYGA